ncbi:DarT ssDNA thymidine ADP-ribosyltransferase family protein [Nitrosomonas sp.]|uniref:DarT ssDNA thymidine ADP-ribosyltransferase family protein n=1 Tax=Nitrosomonas sp. TaxID=42353 RepID=UPI0026150554|nr:DarT ssDNA thymidine ADP-ribosyltransferase family protein [Nitrosomonas sp.]MCW5602387.1 DUF4433 domain-containing protein [Nitrosomonas sp.]
MTSKINTYPNLLFIRQAGLLWLNIVGGITYFFEARCELAQLNELDWQAIQAIQWQSCKEGKQAAFLMEGSFPWHWVELIGVHSRQTYQHVTNILKVAQYRPPVTIEPAWYY